MAATARAVAPRRASAHSRARVPGAAIVRQYALHRAGQIFRRGDFHHRAGGAKLLRDGGEVLHVRADDDGLSEERGLENIVSASRRQRAAHEDAIGEPKSPPSSPMESSRSTPGGAAPASCPRRSAALECPPRPAWRRPRRSAPACAAPASGKTPRNWRHAAITASSSSTPFVGHRAGGDPHLGGPHAFDQLRHRRCRIRRPRRKIVLQISRREYCSAGPVR